MKKVRGITMSNRKQYNPTQHMDMLRRKTEKLKKINEAAPEGAEAYVKMRQAQHEEVRKIIREDRS